MTVGIAAITGSGEHIVAVSDRMISSDGLIQAADNATLKQRKIANTWALMFSAVDSNIFLPIANSVVIQLKRAEQHTLNVVQEAVLLGYQNQFDNEFSSTTLNRYNIPSINSFMNIGLVQFGSERFSQICDQIATFDLGIDLLGYGFDADKTAHIFEVCNPGKIINHVLLGYAVTGSGSWMAMAALRRKKMPYSLEETAYRLLTPNIRQRQPLVSAGAQPFFQ
jgi:hypothetical protein